jgi:hypothetical protein
MNQIRTVESEELDVLPNGYPTENIDFPTTVQVTLAKRILRPGSNKVLCMAAQTSVPLNEDDVASQSDLGLRLADGTSVRLSLSSFNDQTGPAFGRRTYHPADYSGPVVGHRAIAQDRVYDPARYEPDRFKVKGMPNLTAAFMVALLAGAATVAAVSFTKTSSTNTSKQSVVRKHTRPIMAVTSVPAIPHRAKANVPVKSLAVNSDSTATTNKPIPFKVSKQKVAKSADRSQSEDFGQQTNRKKPIASTGESKKESRSTARRGAGSFFVPPPPPVVPLMAFPPYGMAPPQMQYQQPAPPTIEQPVKQVRSRRSEALSLDLPPAFSIQTNGRFGAPFQEIPAKVSPQTAASLKADNVAKNLHPQETPVVQAPIPGSQPQLERIVWPEQAQ